MNDNACDNMDDVTEDTTDDLDDGICDGDGFEYVDSLISDFETVDVSSCDWDDDLEEIEDDVWETADQLSLEILDMFDENKNFCPRSGWVGERGDSQWIPEDKAFQELLTEYNCEGIQFIMGHVDLSPFSKITVQLAEEDLQISDQDQFSQANAELLSVYEDYLENKLDEDDPLADFFSGLSDEDITELYLGNNIPGYTWHHVSDAFDACRTGELQLVDSRIHKLKHIGGRSIDGGGQTCR